jgi:hypothetical protein
VPASDVRARSPGVGTLQAQGLPVALFPQQPRYVAETLLVELLQNGLEGSRSRNGAERALVGAPRAIVKPMRCPERKRRGVPRAKPRRCHGSKCRLWSNLKNGRRGPWAKGWGLKCGIWSNLNTGPPMATEPEVETSVAEVIEMPRLEVRDVAELYGERPVVELEHEPTAAEATEGPWLEGPVLPQLEGAALPEEAGRWRLKPWNVGAVARFSSCDAIPSRARMASSSMILRIASLPDRPQWRDDLGVCASYQ